MRPSDTKQNPRRKSTGFPGRREGNPGRATWWATPCNGAARANGHGSPGLLGTSTNYESPGPAGGPAALLSNEPGAAALGFRPIDPRRASSSDAPR